MLKLVASDKHIHRNYERKKIMLMVTVIIMISIILVVIPRTVNANAENYSND